MIRNFGPLWFICEDDFKHNKQYQASVFSNVHAKMYVIFRNKQFMEKCYNISLGKGIC